MESEPTCGHRAGLPEEPEERRARQTQTTLPLEAEGAAAEEESAVWVAPAEMVVSGASQRVWATAATVARPRGGGIYLFAGSVTAFATTLSGNAAAGGNGGGGAFGPFGGSAGAGGAGGAGGQGGRGGNVTPSAPTHGSFKGACNGSITITNTGSSTLFGSITIEFQGLNSSFVQSSLTANVTKRTTALGTQYLTIELESPLAAGQSLVVAISYGNVTFGQPVSFTPILLISVLPDADNAAV